MYIYDEQQELMRYNALFINKGEDMRKKMKKYIKVWIKYSDKIEVYGKYGYKLPSIQVIK